MRSRRDDGALRALGISAALLLLGGCSDSSDENASGPDQQESDGTTSNRCIAVDAKTPDIGGLGDQIASDPDLEIRVLDNGLTVYVRENDSPGGRGEVSLVVRAGSALEPREHAGTAHFLEHMLFNGTERFPGNQLVQELERFGSAIGPDLNAYTGLDETVYLLQLPDVRRQTRELAVDVVREWADRATIDPDEVDAERGVVLEEMRSRTENAEGRVQLELEKAVLESTAYEGVSTIGTPESIESIGAEQLADFYSKWYTPGNMAVVAVGDFDPDQMADLIEEAFSDLAESDETTRPDLEVSPWDEPRYLGQVESELPLATGSVGWTTVAPDRTTGAGWRDEMVMSLAMDVIANRLADGSARGDNELSDVGASLGFPVRSLAGPAIDYQVSSSDLRASTELVLEEMERVCRFGFNEDEVDRAVKERRAAVEQEWELYDTKQDAQFAGDFRELFLSGAAAPDGSVRHELEIAMLDSISGDNLTAWFGELYSSMDPSIFLAGRADEDVPSDDELAKMISDLEEAALDDVEAVDLDGLELMDPPEPVEPESRELLSAFDGTKVPAVRLEYPNGVVGVVQRSSIAEGTVMAFVRGEGGLTLVADDQVVAARSASEVITSSGAGDFQQDQLDAVMADKSIEVSLSVEPTSEIFVGGSSSADAEELLQLLHVYIASPKATDAAVRRHVIDTTELATNIDQDADMAVFVEAMAARYGKGNSRFELFGQPEELEKLTAAGVESAATALFRGGDWSFAIVGDMELDELEELASKYLGTLPESDSVEPFAEVPGPVDGPVRSDITVGSGDQASMLTAYSQLMDVDETTPVLTSILTALLETRLREVIREELGATYSAMVQIETDDFVDDEVFGIVGVEADPERIDEVVEVVHRELADIAAGGFDQDEFERALSTTQADFELMDNPTLGETQLLYLRHPGWSYTKFVSRAAEVNKVEREDLVRFASSLFDSDQFVEVVQKPAP